MIDIFKIFVFFIIVPLDAAYAQTVKISPVDVVLKWHQEQCENDIRAEKGARYVDNESFIVDPDSVYQIDIGNGMSATVIYKSFVCGGYGRYWCGSGGCGFFIVVGNRFFQRQLSYKPQGIVLNKGEQTKAVMFGVHGINCFAANGADIFGFETCYILMTWNNREQTFQSPIHAVTEVTMRNGEWIPITDFE